MTSSGVPLKFAELFSSAASRAEIVVTFLALLELVRLKQLRCGQEGPFGEIELRRV
jgi:segregation and condensation protein A